MEHKSLPVQLQNDAFRFCKIDRYRKYDPGPDPLKPKPNTNFKSPVGKNWNTDACVFTYQQISEFAFGSKPNNYGVMGGYGGLVIIDCDAKELMDHMASNAKDTFTVKTAKGFHYYYLIPELKENLKPTYGPEKIKQGDIQSYGVQVVGPYSQHVTGCFYEVYKDLPIATMSLDEFYVLLKDFLPAAKLEKAQPKVKQYKQDTTGLNCVEILRVWGYDVDHTITNSGDIKGPSPVHASTTGTNFKVTGSTNKWRCWACQSGGGPFQLIALLEGLMDCQDIVKGSMTHELYKKIESIAISKYGYVPPAFTTEIDVLKYITDQNEFVRFGSAMYRHTTNGYIKTQPGELENYIMQMLKNIAEHCSESLAKSIQKVKFFSMMCSAIDKRSVLYDDMPDTIVYNGIAHNMRTDVLESAGVTPLTTSVAPQKIATPTWDLVLGNIFGNDKELLEYVQRCVGCTISGVNKDELFFILYGTGANGKSTFLETIKSVLGSYYAVSIDTSLLVKKRNTERASYEVARLYRKRLVIAPEATDGDLDEAMVKRLASIDEITAREIYSTPFSFIPSHKVWLTTNNKPVLRGSDHGLRRRLKMIPFTNVVSATPIPNMKENLEREAPGILQWCIDGYKKYLLAGGVGDCSAVNNTTQTYIEEQDSVATFLAEECVKSPTHRIKTRDCLNEYNAWAGKSDHHYGSSTFNERMKKLGVQWKHTDRGNYFLGIYIQRSSVNKYSTEIVGEFITHPITGEAI